MVSDDSVKDGLVKQTADPKELSLSHYHRSSIVLVGDREFCMIGGFGKAKIRGRNCQRGCDCKEQGEKK